MSQQKTLPPRSSYADQPYAYNPVTEPLLFSHVIRKRCVAFLIDALIIFVLTAIAYVVVAVLGIITLGLAWLLFGLVFPAVGLGYNALTIGGPNSATIGQRMMNSRGAHVVWRQGVAADRGLPRAPVLVLSRHLLPHPALGVLRPQEAHAARSPCRGGCHQPAVESLPNLERFE